MHQSPYEQYFIRQEFLMQSAEKFAKKCIIMPMRTISHLPSLKLHWRKIQLFQQLLRGKQFFIIKNDIHIDVGASIIDIKCRENKTEGNSLFYYQRRWILL